MCLFSLDWAATYPTSLFSFFLFLFIHCRPNLNPNSYKGLFGFGESVFRSSKERHLKKPKWWIIQKTQIINALLVFLICFILEGERQFVAVVSSSCIKWMVIFYKQAKHSRDGTPGTGKTTTNSLVAEGTELRWRRRRRECNWVWVVFLVFVKKPLCFDLFLWHKKKKKRTTFVHPPYKCCRWRVKRRLLSKSANGHTTRQPRGHVNWVSELGRPCKGKC